MGGGWWVGLGGGAIAGWLVGGALRPHFACVFPL